MFFKGATLCVFGALAISMVLQGVSGEKWILFSSSSNNTLSGNHILQLDRIQMKLLSFILLFL